MKAREDGKRYKGRKPSFTPHQLATVQDLMAQNVGPSSIAKAAGLSRQAVYRIMEDPAAAVGSLREWGLMPNGKAA